MFSLYASVVIFILLAIFVMSAGGIAGGVVLLLCALLNAVWAYYVRARIPFSATILELCVEVIQRFPATVYTAFAAIAVQIVWLIIWIICTASVLRYMNQTQQSDGAVGFASFLLLLSFYWTSQTIKNLVHVTVSGTLSSWYFSAADATAANPTMGALKRACTTSLGSVALGSFLVALIRTVRALVHQARRSRNTFIACCVECLLAQMERAIEFFNVYAFSHVAMYGHTYCQAGQDTWNLLKGRGFDLLINDQLIEPVLVLGALIVGALTAIFGVLLAKFAWNLQFWGAWAFVGFLVGLAIAICAMEVVSSCVATLFVCYAEDPNALAQTKPNDYNRLSNACNGRLQALRVVDNQAPQSYA